MPLPILMGFEQEMPVFASVGLREMEVDCDDAVELILELAARRLPNVLAENAGLFLSNSMVLHDDCGKLEIASPECSHPNEIVCYAAAAERIVTDLLDELVKSGELRDPGVFRCNVSYGSFASWGYHESILTRTDPLAMGPQMIPFLVARVVTAGAGGFVPNADAGCAFTLSPRARHIDAPQSTGTMDERGIFNLKDEPLSTNYGRVHLICSESLCSHFAIWLRAGSTAIVTAMVDAGIRPARGVELADPVAALRLFASDPTCKAQARAGNGRLLSAIDIQRHYAEIAADFLDADWMPPFAHEVIGPWIQMLDRLDGAPDSVATTLDWAIKHRLFTRHLQQSENFSWPLLRRWDALAGLLDRCVKVSDGKEASLDSDTIDYAHGAFKNLLALLEPHLSARGISLHRLPLYLKIRAELFALDFNFGKYGRHGIFNSLDRAGALNHQVPGVTDADIDRAVRKPPALGRARLRGDAIRRLHKRSVRVGAGWTTVHDSEKGLALDLNDPFASSELWKTYRRDGPENPDYSPF